MSLSVTDLECSAMPPHEGDSNFGAVYHSGEEVAVTGATTIEMESETV